MPGSSSIVWSATGSQHAENGSDEKEDGLDDSEGDEELDERAMAECAAIVPGPLANVLEAVPERIPQSVGMVVESQQNGRGQIQHKDDKVKEGGHKLHRVAEKEDGHEREKGD